MCYTVTMKKKKSLKKEKMNKKRAKLGPFRAFSLTLGVVLLSGLLLIAGAKLLAEPAEEPEGSGTASGQEEPLKRKELLEQEEAGSLWETVPDEKPQVQEVLARAESSKYAEELADIEYRKANRIYAWEASSENEVTLGFIGDILLDDEYAVMASLLRRGASIDNGISAALLEKLQGVDILVANNEFPFTDRGTPTEDKTFTFRADTAAVAYLHDIGVDAAVLANNHIYDFGEVGLLDTLDTLEQAGIPYVGAGRNLDEASAPIYYIVNDIKIALVAATQIERLDNPDTKGATETSPGVFRCLNPERLYETVANAKANSDFVVVYIHWGTENVTELDWAQLDQAPKLAQAGADLIIGDHPHCLQGIAYYDDTPVIYSMGNFLFNSKTIDTGMVCVTIDKEGLKSFQFVPALQSDCRVDLVYGAEKERILTEMRELSPGVVIDADGYVSSGLGS